ncbi:hypothetical protein WDU94_003699 [Cyamophila willieti]
MESNVSVGKRTIHNKVYLVKNDNTEDVIQIVETILDNHKEINLSVIATEKHEWSILRKITEIKCLKIKKKVSFYVPRKRKSDTNRNTNLSQKPKKKLKEVLINIPQEKKQEYDEIVRKIKRSVHVMDNAAEVLSINKTEDENAKILINEKELGAAELIEKKINECIGEAAKAQLTVPKSDYKTLIMRDIDTTVTKEELSEELKKVTGGIEVNILNLKMNYTGSAQTATVSLPPQPAAKLINEGRVKIDWSWARVEEMISLTRCYPRVNFHKEVVPEDEIELFTIEELVEAEQRIKPNKAPGPDQIPPKVVKEVALGSPQLLLDVFNQLLTKGDFPRVWKEGRVVLIPKPKKPGQQNKYRPICLMDTFGKLYESLIIRRIIKELDEKNALSPNQYGFRSGKSTVEAIQQVTRIARREIEKGRSRTRNLCILVTLDIKNAFSSAPWKEIIDALTTKGISPYLINIVKSYLHDRRVTHGEVNFCMSAGVPQGSIGGGTLWNILYDQVLQLDLPENIQLVAFADDLAVVAVAKKERDLENLTNNALEKIQNWMNRKQLEIAPEKSEAVILSGKKKCLPLNIHICGQQIKVKKEIKYLGVVVDSRLSFGPHLKYVTEKANKTSNALAHILPRTGGAGENKRRVLQSATDSVMLYAAPVWSSCLRYKTYAAELLKQQRKSLLRVCRGYVTVSTEAVAVLSRVIPIDLMAIERSKTFGRNKEERETERENTMTAWQNRWDETTSKAQWTKKLIPVIKPWYERKHGEITYEMTQAFTGHGCFQTYLLRIGKAKNASCVYCNEENEDSPEHTLFQCNRWNNLRTEAENRVSATLNVNNMLNIMLQNQDNWNTLEKFIQKVMQEKQKLENPRRNQ